jgi:hypothetical protein
MVRKVAPGKYQWPSGKITTLALPERDNQFYIVRYPANHPEQASFVSTVLSKEDLFHDFFHFYVTKPNSLKRCSSCHKSLSPQSPCIQTDTMCILVNIMLA